MRSVTRHWLIVLGVVSALLLAEGGARLLSPSIPPPSKWPTVETEVKSEQLEGLASDIDVLFLGSSMTEAAVDPDLLTSNPEIGAVYNSAMPFSTPVSDQSWLERVILPEVSPSVVIIGVPAWPPHSSLDSDPLRHGIEAATSAAGLAELAQSSVLLSNRGAVSGWDGRRAREEMVFAGHWTEEGHTRAYYDRPSSSLRGGWPEYGIPEMSDDNADALRQVVSGLTSSGVQVVLMTEPGHFPGEVADSDVEAYLGSIAEVARELDVGFWDTYHVEWDSALFVDEAHFTRKGTVAFTEYLEPQLTELIGS